jgi:pimeloyl-ACP methyl ester carboxylesterase/class 3 adenylate cyclase
VRDNLTVDVETKYAKVGDIHVAYQTIGEGPIDLVYVPGIFTHVEWQWEERSYAAYLRDLGAFSRLIMFDPRGLGLSDRSVNLPTLEQQIDDVRAVLDAVRSDAAYIYGVSQGGLMAMLFAATHPSRTRGLILYGAYPTARAADDFPWGRSREWIAEYSRQLDEEWGTGAFAAQVAPTRSEDDSFRRWWGRLERFAAGPGNALAFARMNMDTDVRPILGAISAPTLILQRRGDTYRANAIGGYLAAHIPASRLVELPGIDHLPYVGNAGAVVREIEAFVTGEDPRREPDVDRELATVVFIDIVQSTERLAFIGDSRWTHLLDRFLELVRTELAIHRGREIDTAGDGILSRFDGPARAVRFALAVSSGVQSLDLQVRAGIHTGELYRAGEDVRGIAVHMAARVAAAAGPGQVLTSSTVRDLVAGSGLAFDDQGEFALKGLDGKWHLFAASDPLRVERTRSTEP